METFVDVIRSQTPVLVVFFANWCGACRLMLPMLCELADRVIEWARVIKIDIDRNDFVTAFYEIKCVPTIIIFKSGVAKWRRVGIASLGELHEHLLCYC